MKKLLFAFLFFSVSVNAQDLLFSSSEVLELSILADMDQLLKLSPDTATVPAILKSKVAGEMIETECRLRKRGVARQKPDVCKFPPILVRFDTLDQSSLFWPSKKLKLVTHCQSGMESYEQYLILEYLVYKMYNLFTNYSFKVRMAQVNYIDIKNTNDTLKKLAFFIEDQNRLANSLNCIVEENDKVHQEWTNRDAMTITSLFQFMIGNVDWAIPCQHNIKLLKSVENKTLVAVPYDFDCTGFINPPYASANELLGQQSVRQRLFRGYARTDEELEAAFSVFKQKRQSIDSLIINQVYLKERYKKMALDYIGEFYELIENPKQVNKKIKRSFRE